VVAGERRLPLTADTNGVGFDLPVLRASPTADSATVQVWSQLSGADTGIRWLVEHNDPERAVGHWAGVVWPAGPVRAVVSYLAACDAILRDSGLAAEARRRGHFFQLQGFETNNALHQDNPPHWHLAYYPGPNTSARPATVPHFWVDAQGRTFYNGQDVSGSGRSRFHANEAAPIYDGVGNYIIATAIRGDGGLEVWAPSGTTYSITGPGGDFTGRLDVLRNGGPWRTVTTQDLVGEGILRIDVAGVGAGATRQRVEYRYDPLTGVVLGRTETPGGSPAG
jgi:hypothetical protein